ncbi:MAG: DNA alkylation repair protein [Crocinitomicaceae bacterium]
MNIKTVIKDLKTASDIEKAKSMQNYMQGRFSYYGVMTTERRAISKTFIKESQTLKKSDIKALVIELYAYPQRELHHIALEIALPYFKKQVEIGDLNFFEKLAMQNQWWDTIDVIAPKLMANYFLKFPDERDMAIDKWLVSNDKWLIRCAILFQLKYKTNTDLNLLFETILRIPPTEEFFINKAIGWILRENTRLYPNAIIDFVRDNGHILSALSKKEALRLLK